MAKGKKKIAAKKPTAKKTGVKKTATKKAVLKKTAPKKVASKKTPTKSKVVTSKKVAAEKTAMKAAPKPASKASSMSQGTPAKKSAKKTANVDLSNFVTPLDDRLIVMPKEVETRTAGGLYIPDTVMDRGGNLEGFVVSVGRGHRNAKGYIRPMDVKVGDRILFAKHAGNQIKIQDYDLLIVREADVLGVVG